eukprot:COSAG01_NODE_52815_length_344_cov_0.424490_1_plen_69_part_00
MRVHGSRESADVIGVRVHPRDLGSGRLKVKHETGHVDAFGKGSHLGDVLDRVATDHALVREPQGGSDR